MKRILALIALLTLVLAGCGKDDLPVTDPQAGTEPPTTEQGATDPTDEPPETPEDPAPGTGLTGEEAKARVVESLNDDHYTAELTDETLTVGKDEESQHDYFVIDVKDLEGASVGRVAVDQQTGDKYNYLGDGVLDDYATFPLYDPTVDAVCDWEGSYTGPAKVTLDVLQGDGSSFEFAFSDGTTGNAQIAGNTAKSVDGKINFLFSDDVITVAGGGVTGNYTAS